MHIAMSQSEIWLLESFLRCSSRYVEFGAGGSTYLAASLVKESVLSVDSSQEWLDKVRMACVEGGTPIKPELCYIDIGPTGKWGMPIDHAHKHKWPTYHSEIWNHHTSCIADFYLIDGRFRVASFMQTLIHAGPNAIIAIHDFSIRPHYYAVHEVSREIARVENLSVFVRSNTFNRERAAAILQAYEYNAN